MPDCRLHTNPFEDIEYPIDIGSLSGCHGDAERTVSNTTARTHVR